MTETIETTEAPPAPPLPEVGLVDCARCRRELYGERTRDAMLSGVRYAPHPRCEPVAGRLDGRPYCSKCLHGEG
jgi:hypothetical protein